MRDKAINLGNDRRSSVRLSLLLCGLASLAGGWQTPLAWGVEMESLYTVEVPLDPDSGDPEADANRAALNEVLIRLTGSTDIAESEEMLDLFPNPRIFISQYQEGRGDTLIVSFEGEALERVLRQTSAPVWGSDRLLTIAWLAVDWGMGVREIIGSDEQTLMPAANRTIDRNKMLRERMEAVATRRGIPIVFPLLDAEDRQRIGFSDIWGGFDDQLIAAAVRYGASSVLVGRLRPGSAQANRWTWYNDGQRLDWTGEPEDALNTLADAMVASEAIPGNQRGDNMQLKISGINSVSAYGAVQRYLEKLRILDHLMIDTVSADSIIYDIEARGGIDRLRTALRASGFLVPTDPFNAGSQEVRSNPFGTHNQVRDIRDAAMLTYFYQQKEKLKPMQNINQDFVPISGPN